MNLPHKYESLSAAHRAMGLPAPKHPLISVITAASAPVTAVPPPPTHVLSFYKISYRPLQSGKLKYGQNYYDFEEGGLLFAAPGQIIGNGTSDAPPSACSEFVLLIHPDFFGNAPLGKSIKQYGFFSYSANEALHLSEEEKTTIFSIFKMIEAELNSRIDDFSQNVIIAQIELLLNYADRFYKRQFITRKTVNHDLLQRMDDLLEGYFESSILMGLPTVAYVAEQLNLTPAYLSDMLRSLIGQNAQQHIHEKLIEKAKEKLSTTALSASEIAYSLGFEHPQSFTRLFKSKTNESPMAFRARFN